MSALLLTLGNEVAAAEYYTLAGPSTATTGIQSDPFTVELGPGSLDNPDTITPDDGGAGGTFSVVSVVLTNTGRIATFRYTRETAGTITISVTDSGSLTDPPPIILEVSDPLTPEELRASPIVMLRPAPTLWYRGAR